MPAWYYFVRPRNTAFHDLRDNKDTPIQYHIKSLLGLSLKFCPTPRYTHNKTTIATTLLRHQRDLWLKHYFIDSPLDSNYNPRLYSKSSWIPPIWKINKELQRRFIEFEGHYTSLFKRQHGHSNLLPSQRIALQLLQKKQHNIIVNCDKNLGPAIIEREKYINMALNDHLLNHHTYQHLTSEQATEFGTNIRKLLTDWLKRWKTLIPSNERSFIKQAMNDPNTDPISTFYLLMKVHKTPIATRPIVSCSGTLLHSLGVWVDDKLQRIVTTQQSYFKSSATLKKQIITLDNLDESYYSLYTADAQSMYTNIDTEKALHEISMYLHKHRQLFLDVPVAALMDALTIIMKNNVFRFGDTHWQQLTGTAMGTPPAPPYATLYYAIHEETLYDEFGENLFFYKRFIDDIFGIWKITDFINDASTWQRFCLRLNDFGLTWDVNDRSKSVNFMDLTIFMNNNHLSTTLFEKKQNPYSYIPPHSAHPPGVLTGLVYGNVHRIYTLCSETTEQKRLLSQFYQRLLLRGYKPSMIDPLFTKAAIRFNPNTTTHPTQSQQTTTSFADNIFLHLPFHPGNPSSSEIQHTYKNIMLHPQYKKPLSTFTNTERLIVAYSRPHN